MLCGANAQGVLLDEFPNAFAAQAAATPGKKQPTGRHGRGFDQLGTLVVQVFLDGLDGATAERHETFFIAFAPGQTKAL